LRFANVYVHSGDGSVGWPGAAPYGAIIVTAAAPSVPGPLLEQLSDGAHLVLPLGYPHEQVLELFTRRGNDVDQRVITSVAFVPLLGKYGWKKR
jgi:protein-L-isoaspartate(D-aspartate) O-methyltransferase